MVLQISMKQMWNFYRPHLLLDGAKNCCASLSDTGSEKYHKNKSKKYKIWISTSVVTPWQAPLNFRADRVVFFFLCDLLCLPSRFCPREEAQIQLLMHLT
jgi:hypothetical protein